MIQIIKETSNVESNNLTSTKQPNGLERFKSKIDITLS